MRPVFVRAARSMGILARHMGRFLTPLDRNAVPVPGRDSHFSGCGCGGSMTLSVVQANDKPRLLLRCGTCGVTLALPDYAHDVKASAHMCPLCRFQTVRIPRASWMENAGNGRPGSRGGAVDDDWTALCPKCFNEPPYEHAPRSLVILDDGVPVFSGGTMSCSRCCNVACPQAGGRRGRGNTTAERAASSPFPCGLQNCTGYMQIVRRSDGLLMLACDADAAGFGGPVVGGKHGCPHVFFFPKGVKGVRVAVPTVAGPSVPPVDCSRCSYPPQVDQAGDAADASPHLRVRRLDFALASSMPADMRCTALVSLTENDAASVVNGGTSTTAGIVGNPPFNYRCCIVCEADYLNGLGWQEKPTHVTSVARRMAMQAAAPHVRSAVGGKSGGPGRGRAPTPVISLAADASRDVIALHSAPRHSQAANLANPAAGNAYTIDDDDIEELFAAEGAAPSAHRIHVPARARFSPAAVLVRADSDDDLSHGSVSLGVEVQGANSASERLGGRFFAPRDTASRGRSKTTTQNDGGAFGAPPVAAPLCKQHNMACVIATSRSEANNGRDFWGCPKSKADGGCGFNAWCDESAGGGVSIVGGGSRPTAAGGGNAAVSSQCFNCQGVGHFASSCPMSRGSGGGGRHTTIGARLGGGGDGRTAFSEVGAATASAATCFTCGEAGHFQAACPSRRTDRNGASASSRGGYGGASFSASRGGGDTLGARYNDQEASVVGARSAASITCYTCKEVRRLRQVHTNSGGERGIVLRTLRAGLVLQETMSDMKHHPSMVARWNTLTVVYVLALTRYADRPLC